jgi:N-acetylglutamate synthase-like GNAT family acetyltransferase
VALHVRPRQVGDIGWACMRQCELYAKEFGYSQVFEDYVIRSFAPFVERFDSSKDGLWIASLDGIRVGCIAIQHDVDRPGWAQLRWYFVEADARGHGLGRELLDTALAFCRKAGYEGIWLLTVDDLGAARKQYEKVGFKLVHTDAEPCEWAPWGHEQHWALEL